jgi:hypothetical protein
MTDHIELPPPSDPCWANIATGRQSRPWQSLEVKLRLARAKASTKNDSSPANVEFCAKEIHDWFQANRDKACQDLIAIKAGNFDRISL